MPTEMQEDSHQDLLYGHTVIAITSEPLVDKAIAADGEKLRNDEDIIADLHVWLYASCSSLV